AYTTVLTMLRTLEEKGYVTSTPDGRAHRYTPSIGRETAQRSATRALVRKLFDGSTELLLTHLVTDEKLTKEQIERIKKLLDEHRGPASRLASDNPCRRRIGSPRSSGPARRTSRGCA